MNKNKNLNENFIEIDDLLKGIWKDKLIILILVLVFGILGYSYGHQKLKIFQTQTKIKLLKKKDFYLVSFVDDYFKSLEYEKIYLDLNKEFNVTLLSTENINKFFDKNKIKDLKSNWISLENITTENQKENFNVYSLVFKKPLQAQKILNDYVLFTFNELEQNFKKRVSTLVSLSIQKYENHLNYATKANIDQPINNINIALNNNTISNNLFFKGSIILAEELAFLKKEFNKVEKFSFDKNIFLQKPSAPTMITKNEVFFGFIAMVIGIFFSLFVVISRLILLKK